MSGIGLLMFFWPGLFRRDERADQPAHEDRNVKTVLEFRAFGALRQLEANPVVETLRDRGVYLVRDAFFVRGAIPEDMIIALRAACTYCGRTLNWLEPERKFKCPQCGSGYRMSGEHFEGPARRSLERLGIRLAGDGDLAIDAGKRFQKELGQWQDAESFVRP
jgi:Rieske Fe-S protein